MEHQLLRHIGRTPLLEARRFAEEQQSLAHLYAKCECFNPGGSVKDRPALYMLNDAEQRGMIAKGAVIVEPTSGNTGIGLAVVCAQRGYRLILTMPESMSLERRSLLQHLGAELVLTKASLGMQGAVDQAMLIAAGHKNSFIPNQFANPANAAAHYFGTAPEIWEELDGQVDVFVAGVGSGGTVTGAGGRLKELNPDIRIVAVEPAESPLLSAGRAGTHGIQGIGANFVPALLDRSVIDEIIPVCTAAALETARAFSRREGLSVGISAGAALSAALTLAAREQYAGRNIVALLPDGGERYMSTDLFK